MPRIQEWLTKNKYFLGGAVNRAWLKRCARSAGADLTLQRATRTCTSRSTPPTRAKSSLTARRHSRRARRSRTLRAWRLASPARILTDALAQHPRGLVRRRPVGAARVRARALQAGRHQVRRRVGRHAGHARHAERRHLDHGRRGAVGRRVRLCRAQVPAHWRVQHAHAARDPGESLRARSADMRLTPLRSSSSRPSTSASRRAPSHAASSTPRRTRAAGPTLRRPPRAAPTSGTSRTATARCRRACGPPRRSLPTSSSTARACCTRRRARASATSSARSGPCRSPRPRSSLPTSASR